jgi:hypothetical protein
MMSHDEAGPDGFSPSYVWAYEYRKIELSVIPAVQNEKRPLAQWREFQENGIPPATFERWYGERGEHRLNPRMGFITGRACLDADHALFVIDLDVKDGANGLATWRGLLAVHNNDADIETWTVVTGSGGRHLYFRCPADRCPGTKKELSKGIDVRGVGGFIMAPPSPHHAPGTRYEWVDGLSPWSAEIADAPEWLIEWAQTIAGSGSHEHTAEEVKREQDAFGLGTGKAEDGRETLMYRMVYAAFLNLTRKGLRIPTADELVKDVWPVWQQSAKVDVQGKATRGFTQVREKCAYVLDRFNRGHLEFKTLDDIMDGADKEGDTPGGDDWSAGFGTNGGAQEQAGPVVIQTTAQFVQEWAPKPFVLKPVLEQGRLYTATGKTGTGKTAIALLIALHIARGAELAGRRVKQCDVLFLAGENHEDVRTRWLTMLKIEGIDPNSVGVHFVGGRFSIEGHFDVVKAHLEKHATGLVIVDTLQAFFDGDDSNSNEQMKALAHVLRRISSLGPAVLVPAHPTKSATKDNNVPYGGGALLNEIDGNLSLWGDAEAVELSWCGKFRGSFEPLTFGLDVVEMPGVTDADGDPIKTVKARVVGALEAEMKAQQHGQALRKLLFLINDHPGASERNLVKLFSDRFPDEPRGRGTVQRRLGELAAEKMAEKTLGHWRLTAKGARFIGVRHGEE